MPVRLYSRQTVRIVAFTAVGADGKTNLWVRAMNAADAHSLADTSDAIFPFWSPDSRSLGFFANGKLRTIDLNGSSAQTVCDAQLGRGGAWGPNGVIVFSPSPIGNCCKSARTEALRRRSLKLDTALHSSHRWPFFLPDGKHFLYFAMDHNPSRMANNGIYYASLDGRDNRMLVHSQTNAIYAAGFLLFNRGDQLMAQPFDPDKGALSGELQTVSSDVLNDVSTWHTSISATNSGLLTFGNGSSGAVQLVWMDRSGKPVSIAADNLQNLQFARLSPQGDRIALTMDSGMNDVWSLDLARGVSTRLTFGPTGNTFPVWSPDGKWIAYSSLRPSGTGIYRRPTDGSGAEELLFADPAGLPLLPMTGRTMARRCFFHPTFSCKKPMAYGRCPWTEIENRARSFRMEPTRPCLPMDDGSPTTQKSQVELKSTCKPMAAAKANGRSHPTEGKRHAGALTAKSFSILTAVSQSSRVAVNEAGGALEFGAPQTLISQWTILTLPFFSVSPDGKRLLMERVSQQVNQPITLITNFTANLKK